MIIILIIIVAIVGYIVFVYNALISMIESVRNNEKQIDIQLDRRFKVFESLIEVLKKYMDYEQSTLSKVVELRNSAQNAKASGNSDARMQAENEISKIASNLNVVFEQYPDLKANQNALQLQEEVVNTENKLAFSKQAYNDSIEQYNARKKSFPASFVVSTFKGNLDFDFAYWQLDADDKKSKENYSVKL
jgi:LemA protein